MSTQSELNFEQDEGLGGFRLHRFELLNWGTFDGGVRVMPLNGRNGLLTGDNGSGKSTVLDAVTTLLIPPSKLSYNKAAGADSKERSLKSYVEGYYRSERSDESLASKPVALRKAGTYSVLLGYFHNESLNADLTLAQVFWVSDGRSQPERLYAAAERDLSIVHDFSGFGKDIKGLRKKLRDADVQIFDNYPQYMGCFSRAFGIRNSQALDLFNQTVSMKTVGDLTGFVRSHMLERFDSAARVQNLIHHFDDLTGAHDAVLKAKRQIEMLTPVEEFCQKYGAKREECDALDTASAALDCWISGFRIELLEKDLKAFSMAGVELKEKIKSLEQSKADKQFQKGEIDAELSREGGARIQSIDREISRNENELHSRKLRAEQYNKSAAMLGLAACDSVAFFAANTEKVKAIKSAVEDGRAALQNETMEVGSAKKKAEAELAVLQSEIESLRARRTNIEARCVELRMRICGALGLREEDIPFAGELIEVRESEKAWEGAAERLLHNFGLSMLVPDKHYKAVSDWVDRNNLRGRLVYFRVRENAASPAADVSANILPGKLALKEDSPLYRWLWAELVSRFSYACCSSMDEFRREPKAITRNGQIKSSDKRHEKDDRYNIDDRSRYILGWNNAAKLAILEREADALVGEAARCRKKLDDIRKRQKELDARMAAATQLDNAADFSELDWKKTARDLELLKAELKALQSESKKLDSLKKRSTALAKELHDIDAEIIEKNRKDESNSKSISICQNMLAEDLSIATENEKQRRSPSFPMLAELHREMYQASPISLDNSAKRRREMFERLMERKKSSEAEASRISNSLVEKMSRFKTEYIVETQDFGADMESAPEYMRLLAQLRRDDLPRFEAKFRKMLKEKTVQEIALFHENLNKTGREIEDRIDTINGALVQIDYEPGRYIKLEAEREKDMVIRQFQSDLRECTQDILGSDGDEGIEERRFASVEKIISRFKGRPDHSSEDKKWTDKVTDVRNWYSFAASERWREDDTEYEHYSDSSGKSGGQKEKLAYTILAASLAYQFGLSSDGASRARTFRFVMIDEAFGRGSDESAQFALTLFQKLNLQLLVATPLQKIQVIEPFVSHVTFISNADGSSSAMSNLTIEEYKERKKSLHGMDDEERHS